MHYLLRLLPVGQSQVMSAQDAKPPAVGGWPMKPSIDGHSR
jgi:hypothetical protein